MHTKLKWETVVEDYPADASHRTLRAPITGGWLVEVWNYTKDSKWGGGLTFVADPTHSWTVDTTK